MGLRFKIAIAALLFSIFGAEAQSYYSFENINQGRNAATVGCFIQDPSGLIWMGTDSGLCSYDGYQTQAHYNIDDSTSTRLYCGLMLSDDILVVGGDNGIQMYNIVTDRYLPRDTNFPSDVRALILKDEVLWIGSLNGLYKYYLDTEKLERVDGKYLSHQAIYSLAYLGGDIYIGTYNGLCVYVSSENKFEVVPLPSKAGRGNQFINSLLADNERGCVWVGTEDGLSRYEPEAKKAYDIPVFKDNSYKSLVLDRESKLIIGTDNGGYVYDPEKGSTIHMVHDSRDNRSLINNIVWSVFRDRDDNIWFGTDNGISLAPNTETSRFVPISDITGIGDGNQFYSIFRDSGNNLWLGGTNGLIRCDTDLSPSTSVWYRMSDRSYPIPHNRIRDIYEDSGKRLWIATDGGINLYSKKHQQFVSYNITDSSATRNANWAYHILEDANRNYWVTSYLGGVFKVSSQALLSPSVTTVVAERNWVASDGLRSDAPNNIASDGAGGIMVQCYPEGLQRIDMITGEVSDIIVRGGNGFIQPNYLRQDGQGDVWVSGQGWIVRINPATGKQDAIRFDEQHNGWITGMDDSPSFMWVTTSAGIYAINKVSLDMRRIEVAERNYSSIYYDSTEQVIYAGCTDGILIFSHSVTSDTNEPRELIVTSIHVNNRPFIQGRDYAGLSVRKINDIKLSHKQNNVSFTVSDLNYSSESRSRLVYRLEGLEDEWTPVSGNGNQISYPSLTPGGYKLMVRTLGASGEPSGKGVSMGIRIKPPWYFSTIAKIIYILLGLGLAAWIIKFFNVRHKLRIERIRKQQSLKLSNLKMEFLTNISHEFKTPLSLILGPLGRLMGDTSDPDVRRQLEMIQRNAIKLNSLTHQVLELNRNDAEPGDGIMLSQVEFTEFARSIFSTYEENIKDKQLEFGFTSSHESIFTEVDIVKAESILNNLMSNSCKYTTEWGRINMDISLDEINGMLLISVSDTGIGIPESELPYIFGRFFQSSATKDMNKGTGIGLYMVKQYAESHGGSVEISSTEGKGTNITVKLPYRGTLATSGEVNTAQETVGNAPLILIVEDNSEISSFIKDLMKNKYRCEVAGNGRIGLEKCIALKPDLIISDIMMPVMDGLEMCRRIRNNFATSTTPIILLTAKDDIRTELESIRLDVNAFIPKPFDPDLLLSRTAQLLSHQTKLRSAVRMETIAEPKVEEVVSPDEKFLLKITEMIESNISDPELNVNELSRMSGISTKQVYRKVKQLTGITPVEYIRTIRLKKSAILLSQKKFSISEVMYMVGFSNSSYFSKCFQQQFGKTPRQYVSEACSEEQ